MYTLTIDCTGFPLEYAVYVTNGDNNVIALTKLQMEEIAAYINNDTKIHKVQLSGPTDYCLGIKADIENTLINEYSKTNIEIEVI